MKNFFIEPSHSHKGQFKLSFSEEVYNETLKSKPMRISYTVLPSRLLGLTHPMFLRFVRQEFEADLHGKTGTYVTYTFRNKEKAQMLANLLNIKWNELLKTN